MTSLARDLPYELDFLHRIGEIRVNGTPVHSTPYLERYALWQRFSQIIFATEIKRFAKTKRFDAYMRGEGGGSIKSFLTELVGLAISKLALLSLLFVRPEIVIFGIDRVSDAQHAADFRLASIYEYCKTHHIRYREILHTVFNRSFLVNMMRRPRLSFYLEAVDTFYTALCALGLRPRRHPLAFGELSGFTEEEARFARHIIRKYLGEEDKMRFRIRVLSAFLACARPKAVWMIDDTRHYQELILAARSRSIPTYAFQHGHFTKYHVGWLRDARTSLESIYPDHLVVANEYWKRELARLGSVFPPDSVIVGGAMLGGQGFASKSPDSVVLTILTPHETDSPKDGVARVMNQLIDAGFVVVFKLRPDYSREQQLAEYPGIRGENIRTVSSLTELDARPNVVIGVYSSLLYDFVEAGIPVGILGDLSDYGSGMVENGLANLIHSDGRLLADIATLAALPSTELEARRQAFVQPTISFRETLDSIRMHP